MVILDQTYLLVSLNADLENLCSSVVLPGTKGLIYKMLLLLPQELEVRSLNHPYNLKTKSSQCHNVVMTRSETKFQAPLNRRYQEVLAKN